MFDFIKLQYQMGKITENQVRNFAPRWLTAEQANEILGESKSGEQK